MLPPDTSLIDPGLLGIARASFKDGGLLPPFVQEIFLIECHIAGTYYAHTEEVEPSLNIGDLLVLKREPENEYDKLAVMILNEHGRKLGYVPRTKNEALARLMDAGKFIFGRLQSKEWVDDRWLKIQVHLYMRDL